MVRGLTATGPAPGLESGLFAFLVGDWSISSRWFRPDGSTVRGEGAVHAGWVLEGTAVQDVWTGRIEEPDGATRRSFGTTLRFPEPAGDAWRCVWAAPAEGVLQELRARRVGDEIVLATRTPEGRPERWVFSEVRGDGFRWRAEEEDADGGAWRLTQDVRARRAQH